MDSRFSEEELLWIRDVLDQHGEYLHDILEQAIENRKLIDSGDLQQSLSYKVVMYGQNPALTVSFLGYGRAIEIRYHKSKNSRRFSEPGQNRITHAGRGRKAMRKKDARWYARNVYGSLNRLIGTLMYEFTEKERERIMGILQYQKQHNP